MPGLTGVDRVQFLLPPIEQVEAARRVSHFVAEVIGPAAERVDVIKVLVEVRWQQPAHHAEILVVGAGQPARVFERFRLSPGSPVGAVRGYEVRW